MKKRSILIFFIIVIICANAGVVKAAGAQDSNPNVQLEGGRRC